MTTEERIKQLEDKIKELENKTIRVNLSKTEKENIKNALFEGYYQSNNSDIATTSTTPYLKVVWKDKVIYIPYYI